MEKQKERGVLDFLFLPFYLVMQSPVTILILMVFCAFFGMILYYRTNTDFFGLVPSPVAQMQYSRTLDYIEDTDGTHWRITWERDTKTIFNGVVRQVVPNHNDLMKPLTHDVMIAWGDYADDDIVQASIINHFMIWKATTNQLSGEIHLIHAIPANDDIYRLLMKVNSGDEVIITGREVLRLDQYTPEGTRTNNFVDDGCNTMVVTNVEFIHNRLIPRIFK